MIETTIQGIKDDTAHEKYMDVIAHDGYSLSNQLDLYLVRDGKDVLYRQGF